MTFENAQNALDALPDMARRGGLRDLKIYLEARAIEELDAAGHVFVSEMARGIDTSAHIDALPFDTVAILAGGVRIVNPREVVDLHAHIIECGTAVSEMPFGVTPQGRHCTRPNRIISSHCRAVASVEAAKRSGSLTTTRFAGDQGR